MDYKELWARLRDYLTYLEERRVTQIAPEILLDKMDSSVELMERDEHLLQLQKVIDEAAEKE